MRCTYFIKKSYINICFFILILTGILMLPPIRAEAQESLTVLPFKSTAGHHDLEQLLTNQLMADLSENPSLCLIDRSNIKDILDEQGLGKTGIIARNTAIQMGQVHGVDYLLTGNIFSPQNLLPRKGSKTPSTRFNVSWKLINTTTGQIVIADTSSKILPKISTKQNGKRIWMTPADAPGLALRDISHEISKTLQEKMAKHTDTVRIAYIDGDMIYIDSGHNRNISIDEVFSVIQDGVTIRDPETGKVLGCQQKILCKIQIEHVNENFSYGKIIEGSSSLLQIGNMAIAS